MIRAKMCWKVGERGRDGGGRREGKGNRREGRKDGGKEGGKEGGRCWNLIK